MKRFILALTGFLLLVSLLACTRMDAGSIKDVSPSPTETPSSHPDVLEIETITVHNARELVENLGSNKHFMLVPGGDYDLNKIDDSRSPYFIDGELEGLENVIIEGQGEDQVDFFTDAYDCSVLYLKNCENITFKNLNLGHEPMVVYESCLGAVLILYDNRNITLEDCTLFGCGTSGIEAYEVKGLSCKDVVIKDCSFYVLYLSETEEAFFSNCEFINKTNQSIQLQSSTDITIENSRLVGEMTEYPNIMDGDKALLNQPSDGASYSIKEQKGENIRLVNVTVTGKTILKELEALHPSVKVELTSGNDELSGARYVDCDLKYSSALEESEYLPQIEQVRQVILTKDSSYDIVYVTLEWPGNDMPIRSGYDGSIWLGSAYTDIARVMNDHRKYLSEEEAKTILEAWCPPLFTNEGDQVSEVLTFLHYNTVISEGDPYYALSISSDYGEYQFGSDFKVNAVDGSIYTIFDGYGYARVQTATEEQIQAVLEYIKSHEEEISRDTVFRAYCVEEDYIIFNNEFTYTSYLIKKENGKLVAEPYQEWMGD